MAPGLRREFKEAHVLAFDIFDPRCFPADFQKLPIRIDAKRFSVGQRIRKTPGPEAAPDAVVRDNQLSRGVNEAADYFTAVKDVGITDDGRTRAEPWSSRGKRHHHVRF